MKERVGIQPLCVKLHSLTLELRLERALTLIKNKVGMMMGIDEKTMSLYRIYMANICVEKNLGDGFPGGIDIQIGIRSYK